ncbi:MAG TPA: flagellar biosynthesis protein FlgL [Pseudorhodoplanes sp.]|nr:flagellar biosynthesis protein FlgL [Pseudorhodoplanes sp.]
MTISGVGLRSSAMVQSLVDMRAQLADLQRQLGTGKKSQTYAGLGLDRGLSVGLRAHLSALSSYDSTINTANVRMNLAQSALTRISDIGHESKTNIAATSDVSMQIAQQSARSGLGEILGLLNTQAGDRYIFSGLSADQPPVETIDHILDGDGARAGLKQLIAERNLADLGTGQMGRLVVSSPSPTSVAVSEDVAGSVFGFKLAAISTTLTGATVSAPAGSPPQMSVDLGAVNPNAGETVSFALNMPDGTSTTITLTATASANPGPNEFTIGVDTTATAANLQAALTNAIGTAARTTLAAASAVQASNEFFAADTNNPPLRVSGPPATATSLVAGTAADTVIWYTGETSATPARQTATARIDDTITANYGMRANEDAIRRTVQNVATLAAVAFSATNPDAQAESSALYDRVRPALDAPPGAQKIEDIQAEIAGAQNSLAAATERHKQSSATLSDLLQSIEGVSNEEVAAQILAMQTNLQASLQTTAMLYQTNILQYI